jgi:hypothetical protein
MPVGDSRYDVIVIGGGPAGMMAAGRAGEHGKRVLLLEKNPTVGKKLDRTGGGRCNITNATFDPHELLPKYGEAEQLLYSPFSQFGVRETIAFFEDRGLPIVIEDHTRAFPKSMRASDVTALMYEYCRAHGVTVRPNTPVVDIRAKSGKVVAVALQDGTEISGDSFIIATGGFSHPETGSTGDGFPWLAALGHTTRPATPTLVPLQVKESWAKSLSGVALETMRVTFFVDGKRAFANKGRVLFTHFGLSGPLILNASPRVASLLREGPVTAMIDCLPDEDHGTLDARLLAHLDAHKNKVLRNALITFLPGGIGEAAFALLDLPDPDLFVHSFSRTDRKRLVQLLKALPLTIGGLMGLDRAIVSDGGIPLSEIDPRTMRSRIVPNLYVVGDVLDVSRPSGGYSLQLCWTSGWVAGNAA